MFWLQQTRRAFERQHEDGGDAQRTGGTPATDARRGCRQALMAEWRVTHCSNVGAACPVHLSVRARSTRNRSLPGFGHPGARPP